MKHIEFLEKKSDDRFPLPPSLGMKARKLFIKKDVLPYKFGIRNFTWLLKVLLLIMLILQICFFFNIQLKDIIKYF